MIRHSDARRLRACLFGLLGECTNCVRVLRVRVCRCAVSWESFLLDWSASINSLSLSFTLDTDFLLLYLADHSIMSTPTAAAVPTSCPYHAQLNAAGKSGTISPADDSAVAGVRSRDAAATCRSGAPEMHICVKITIAAVALAASTAAAIIAYKLHANRKRQQPQTQQRPGDQQQRQGSNNRNAAAAHAATTGINQQDTTQAHNAQRSSAASPQLGPSRLIRIGTRTSSLAMYQAELVQSQLQKRSEAKFASLAAANISRIKTEYEICGINTTGDIDQIKPLTDFASKGVFTKELDVALLQGRIEMAVHCLKDLPTGLPEGICLAATLARGETRDALIVHPRLLQLHQERHAASGGSGKPAAFTLSDLPAGSVIGTSALRRRAAIARSHPHLVCRDIRGNVLTRLEKLDRAEFDAIILAAVGLQRLELSDRIASMLDLETYGYAVGQGTLAILCREDDAQNIALAEELQDTESRLRGEAERSLLSTLQGGCKVPIQVRSQLNTASRSLFLWSAVLSVDGTQHVETRQEFALPSIDCSEASLKQARELGAKVGTSLLASGADAILNEIR